MTRAEAACRRLADALDRLEGAFPAPAAIGDGLRTAALEQENARLEAALDAATERLDAAIRRLRAALVEG